MSDPPGEGKAPLVSVVIPTYGRRPTLFREAVASVRDQTYPRIELIVVDDSDDGLTLKRTGESDEFERIERVTGVDHRGAGDARNTGIWHSEGRFIAFLDDDDTWKPNKIRRQVATFRQADEDVGVVYTALEYVSAGSVIRRSDATTRGDVTRAILEGARLGTFSTLMVRSSLVPRAGLIDPLLPTLEDRDWSLRLSRYCRFESIRTPLVRYRQGDHEQLTDAYSVLADESVPRFERKHRPLAAGFGRSCERRFLCSLQRTCSLSALSSGNPSMARRHAIAALRYRPTDKTAWMYLAAASGGNYTYEPLRRLRRRFDFFKDRVTDRPVT